MEQTRPGSTPGTTEPTDDWRYESPDDYPDDATITLPQSPRTSTERHRPRVVIDGPLAGRILDLSIEVAHAYFTLRTWESLGQEVSIERYVREVWHSTDLAQAWPLAILKERGLIITPDESERRWRYLDELWYGGRWNCGDGTGPSQSATRKAKAKRVVPDPFPAYGEGTWAGTRADLIDTCPRPGTNVVYQLFDPADLLAYIGSSENMYSRFTAHTAKPWVRYTARQCATREDAYWLEAAAIIKYRPYLNEHDYVGGRVNAIQRAGGVG